MAEQPRNAVELPERVGKSFDVLASVRRFQYDLGHFGEILPETQEQVCNEELSYLVEGIDRAARTEFCLPRVGGDLTYFSEGTWKPYMAMLYGGREVAHNEAAKDPRKQFLADASVNDIAHGYHMTKLQPGQQYMWCSPYPYDVAARYGNDFVKSCGLSPERQMGFMYRAICNQNGDVILESQTVDRSDEEAFAVAMDTATQDPNATMDELVRTYDTVLSEKQGGQFYAGRRDIEMDKNVWQQVLVQYDLIRYFLDGLEALARQPLDGDSLVQRVKTHTYGVWAAFKERLDGKAPAVEKMAGSVPVAYGMLVEREVAGAFSRFAAEGRVLTGCGGSIEMLRGLAEILVADSMDVYAAIFGNGKSEDKYGSLEFKCSKGHHNKRPYGKLLENCQKCAVSVRC